MTIKTYFILTTVSCLLFGIGFLLFTDIISSLHNSYEVTPFSVLIMKLYGGALISTGLMGWYAKDAGPSQARRAILVFLIVFDIINTILNIIFVINHQSSLINWIELVVTIGFGLGALYFFIKEPKD